MCLDKFCSPDNPASSHYTAFSHDASTFSITTTGLSGLVNENEIQDAIAVHNYTQETEDRTEEERKRDYRNALRRASYRRKKQPTVRDEIAKTLVLTDNPTSSETFASSNTVSSGIICDTKHQETELKTEEERKRDHRNALRRASYRRKKQYTVQVEHAHTLHLSGNHTSSNYTSFSDDASVFPDTTEVSTGIVNEIELQDGILNDIQGTGEKTEEGRKRDHRNALRRAAYWRNKDKRIQDQNKHASTTSDDRNSPSFTELMKEGATCPPSTLHASVIQDTVLARRQTDNERRHNLTNDQREAKNARSRACHQKRSDELTLEVREIMNENRRERSVQRCKSMSVNEKGESSAQRKANYDRRKKTPCKECIAIPLTDLADSDSECPTCPSRASPVSRAAKDDSSDGDPGTNMPTYSAGATEDIDVFQSGTMRHEQEAHELIDEEYYMFCNEGSDNDILDDDEEASKSTDKLSEIDPFDTVYSNIADNTHVLKLDENCKRCKARKFESETDGFCCHNGQIQLKQLEPIPELMRLWSSMDADSRHFWENIRFLNGHFAFTTLGVSLDENYTNMRSGVYTFRAHGTIYHNVHSFGPSSLPEHLQLYFYDDDPNLDHRKAATKQLDQDVMKRLVDILKENPYSQQFRSLGAHKDNLDDYRIDLNTDKRLDQRRYNRPVSSEVAAIWVEGTDLAKRFDRKITLCGKNNERHSIRVTSGAYDPLSYPLFYPMGELGWHPKLPKRNVDWNVVQNPRLSHDDEDDAEGNSRLCVSVRDYYCYMLQTRPAIFNPILCGARLLQQWAVDMYIKIESCRLRWYRKNQTQIRADLYKELLMR
uniref:Helitron helicase-like domain-containing protein n=2 Tax=Triticum urartu TaxID=4572 RepID=A0A8R7NVN5_TRIUA